MNEPKYTRTNTDAHTYTRTHTHIRTHTYTHTRTDKYTYTYTFTYIYTYAHIWYIYSCSECWALHEAEQQRKHTTAVKMLIWIQGKTRKDRIRNEKFRSEAMVKPITTYITQKRLSWYGQVVRR